MTTNVTLDMIGRVVTISTERVEEILNKKLNRIERMVGTGQRITDPKDLTYVDNLAPPQRFAVDGTIVDGLGTSDTNSTAAGKKDDLEVMFKFGGTMTFTYGTTSYTVFMDKITITEEPGHLKNATTSSQYKVKFTVVVGTE